MLHYTIDINLNIYTFITATVYHNIDPSTSYFPPAFIIIHVTFSKYSISTYCFFLFNKINTITYIKAFLSI